MKTFYDLRDFFRDINYHVIIAADAQTRMHQKIGERIVTSTPAGGVANALEAIALASHAYYIGRGKTEEDRKVLDKNDSITIATDEGKYTLKRLFFSPELIDDYYFGFSNQTLWPLSHAAFEKPVFHKHWFEGYKEVNKRYAEVIQDEMQEKSFVWIHDYQLTMVPSFLHKKKESVVAFFWHIPWPTWEQFRILPEKKDILLSLLNCDFLAFHRGYHVRNFIETVRRELPVHIDEETQSITINGKRTFVTDLPLGIDTDTIKELGAPQQTFLTDIIRGALGADEENGQIGAEQEKKADPIETSFKKYQVILGVDRLDYTKGLPQRLLGLNAFFEQNPEYLGKVIYLGIMAPSRDKIPSYKQLRLEVEHLAAEINQHWKTDSWEPLHMVYEGFTREDVIEFFKKAKVCLVTPLDDGMNLVSKEMVVASATTADPGMLVLSQFAGSAIDLTSALIINPYSADEVASAIKKALVMPVGEKKERISHMMERLEAHNIYTWTENFIRRAIDAAKAPPLQ